MKVLVCSAWPYVHGIPHLGNLIGSLLSGDVFARYFKLKGIDTIYVSGSDMHGTRIVFEAMKLGISPKELAFKNHERIKELLEKWEIEFDNYTCTESEKHKEWVRHFYSVIYEKGYLEEREEERPFCRNCKLFLADRFIVGTCPYCGYENAYGNQCEACGRLLEPHQLKDARCAICGKREIEFRLTRHWYFRLDRLKDELKKYVDSHPEWSDLVKGWTLAMLKELKPRAITRDLKWGIKAPFAEDKVIYVWAEAALGYVSATMELDRFEEFWKGDVYQIYCIGKDNIPFHTIFFPAQLLAYGGLHLPDQIAATHYLNWEGKKFSKSKGIGLWMDEAIELLPAFYWRFYLLYVRPELRDTNFSWDDFEKVINKVLIDGIVNYIYRSMVLSKRNKIKEGKTLAEVKERIAKTKAEVERLIEREARIGEALRRICELANFANSWFQAKKPWEKPEKDVLYSSLQLSKALAIFLYPYVPSLSEKIASMLGVELSWDELERESIYELKPARIAERIRKEELKEKLAKLRSGPGGI